MINFGCPAKFIAMVRVPWCYACTDLKWWRSSWSMSYDKWSYAMKWQRVLQQKWRCKKVRCGSNIWLMWQLSSHKQHRKDWSGVPASTWRALQRACYHTERSTIASVRQVYITWKYIVRSCALWWWNQWQNCQCQSSIWPTKYVEVFGIEVE